jgi:hypothetical protein
MRQVLTLPWPFVTDAFTSSLGRILELLVRGFKLKMGIGLKLLI